MRHYENTMQFYKSVDWENCKAQVLNDRMNDDGSIFCERCGKIILKGFNPNARNNKNAIVFHHKIHLNNFNLNDASISINPSNIAVLHWQCHNEEHGRFNGSGYNKPDKKVYIIIGASCSGKSTFVRERASEGDVILDVDNIWEAVSGQPRYIKPKQLISLVMNIRDTIKDSIARGLGNWNNAYIIDSKLTTPVDRKREAEKYKAHNVEVIIMDATKEECIERLHNNPNGRNIKDYESYIDDYYDNFIKDVE